MDAAFQENYGKRHFVRYAGRAGAVLAPADIRPATVIEWQCHEMCDTPVGRGRKFPLSDYRQFRMMRV